jgi:hypothetical protein
MRAILWGMMLALMACGNVADKPVDAAGSTDVPEAKTTIQVAMTGDDASDGLTNPVKTLKRAIAIATANGAITTISLAVGKYGATNGDMYPYTVPANVTIVGAAAGGTVLAGTTVEEGIQLESGKLQNLEFEDFSVAIRARGTGTLDNVKVRTSMVSVVVESTANLTANNVDITGTPAQCTNVGLQASGSAQVTVNAFTVATVGTVLNQIDQSAVSITKAAITGDPACGQDLFSVSGKSLDLTDTTLSGGNNGIVFTGAPAVTLTNTTISDMKSDGIAGRVATAQITGGELRNNARGGIETFLGTWTLTNVGIKGNSGFGIYIQGSSATALGTLIMRGCTISGDGFFGIYNFGFSVGDYGTAANPGNNTFTGNGNGLEINGNGPRTIDAVGNTWEINTQGSNAQGTYGSQLISGPVSGKTSRSTRAGAFSCR